MLSAPFRRSPKEADCSSDSFEMKPSNAHLRECEDDDRNEVGDEGRRAAGQQQQVNLHTLMGEEDPKKKKGGGATSSSSAVGISCGGGGGNSSLDGLMPLVAHQASIADIMLQLGHGGGRGGVTGSGESDDIDAFMSELQQQRQQQGQPQHSIGAAPSATATTTTTNGGGAVTHGQSSAHAAAPVGPIVVAGGGREEGEEGMIAHGGSSGAEVLDIFTRAALSEASNALQQLPVAAAETDDADAAISSSSSDQIRENLQLLITANAVAISQPDPAHSPHVLTIHYRVVAPTTGTPAAAASAGRFGSENMNRERSVDMLSLMKGANSASSSSASSTTAGTTSAEAVQAEEDAFSPLYSFVLRCPWLPALLQQPAIGGALSQREVLILSQWSRCCADTAPAPNASGEGLVASLRRFFTSDGLTLSTAAAVISTLRSDLMTVVEEQRSASIIKKCATNPLDSLVSAAADGRPREDRARREGTNAMNSSSDYVAPSLPMREGEGGDGVLSQQRSGAYTPREKATPAAATAAATVRVVGSDGSGESNDTRAPRWADGTLMGVATETEGSRNLAPFHPIYGPPIRVGMTIYPMLRAEVEQGEALEVVLPTRGGGGGASATNATASAAKSSGGDIASALAATAAALKATADAMAKVAEATDAALHATNAAAAAVTSTAATTAAVADRIGSQAPPLALMTQEANGAEEEEEEEEEQQRSLVAEDSLDALMNPPQQQAPPRLTTTGTTNATATAFESGGFGSVTVADPSRSNTANGHALAQREVKHEVVGPIVAAAECIAFLPTAANTGPVEWDPFFGPPVRRRYAKGGGGGAVACPSTPLTATAAAAPAAPARSLADHHHKSQWVERRLRQMDQLF